MTSRCRAEGRGGVLLGLASLALAGCLQPVREPGPADGGGLRLLLSEPPTEGAMGLRAWVDALPGRRYRWTVAGATITSAGGAGGVSVAGRNAVLLTAGDAGPLTLGCEELDDAGVPLRQGTLQAAVVTPRVHHLYVGVAHHGVQALRIDAPTGGLAEAGASNGAGTVPVTLAVDPGHHNLYLGQSDTGMQVNRFPLDPATGAPGPVVLSGPRCDHVWGVAFAPSGDRAFFSCKPGADFELYRAGVSGGDLATPGESFRPQASLNPYTLAVDPWGRFLYAAPLLGPGSALFRVDLAAAEWSSLVTTREDTTGGFADLAIDPLGRFLFAIRLDQVTAYAIAPETGHLQEVNSVPLIAYQLALRPDGRVLYGLGNWEVAAVAVDPATGQLSRLPGGTLALDGGQVGGPLAVEATGRWLHFAVWSPHGVGLLRLRPDGVLEPAGATLPVADVVESMLAVQAP